ncbi:MAG: hypothetical protein ACYC6Q_09240 [Syntrophales bacterium]
MIPMAAEEEKVYCPYCHTASGIYFPLNTRSYYRCPDCGLIFSGLMGGMLKLIEKLSQGRWLWGPSLDVFARKNEAD